MDGNSITAFDIILELSVIVEETGVPLFTCCPAT